MRAKNIGTGGKRGNSLIVEKEITMKTLGARKNALSITSALQELSRQPMGTIVILGIAGGLTCFALWRIAQGLLDADKLGHSPRALFRRVAYAISSLAYFALAAIAIGTLFQVATASPRSWASWVLSWPLRTVVLGLAGIVFMSVGAATALRAYLAALVMIVSLFCAIATVAFVISGPASSWISKAPEVLP